jgi:iron complex outermembrane receptor protein
VCLFCSLAGAQSSADQDVLSLSIEELTQVKVYTASRHLQDAREPPSAVSVITAEEIARYGWRTLADVLRSLRGFYTAYDRDYVYLGVRGFLRPGDYNSRILLLINGHRLNDNVYDSAQIGTEFPLDLDLIDHIEIVRGPSSSLFGTNAVFGVINVITRQPADSFIEASGESSSFFGRTGRLTAGVQKGLLSALMSGSWYRSAGQQRLFYPEFAAPQTNWGWAENVDGDRYGDIFADVHDGNLRIQGLFSRRTKIIPTASYGTVFNDPLNYTVDTRGYVDVSYRHNLSAHTELDLRTYYDAYDSVGAGVLGGPDPATEFRAFSNASVDWVGVEANLGRQVGRHRITLGTDYEYSLDLNQKNYAAGLPPVMETQHSPWLAAVYGEAELSLAPKVTLRAGARFDYFDSFGGAFSPRIALIYSPNSRTALKYIFSRAFRAPNAYESYYADTIVVEAPSLHLKPEDIQSHEVVFEHSLTPWLAITADGFYNDLDNLIDEVPDPATGLNHFVNGGENEGRGVEFELDAKRASGLAGRASYTLADAKDIIQDERVANSPLHKAKLNATIPLARRAFAGLEMQYISAQQSYQDTRVPPTFLTNLTLSTRPLWGGWEFSASGYNLFDRRWFSPAGAEHRQAEILQDGRTWRFKISYRLHLHRERSKP